jgi:peptidoglycan hydrolase CwlO-like protein
MLEDDGLAAPMSRARAKSIFVRIAQGLAAMHAVGIHHHDIKPENIFIAEIAGFPGGFPVLLDLGIATKRGENPKGLTVEYASPETAAAMLGLRNEPIGAASDVYSLALSLRNALDPDLVVHEGPAEDVLPRLQERATKPMPLSRRRDVRYLAPHFARWLSLNPEQRPSAAQLAQELAVLTAPEERREARVRWLKRVGPVLVLAAVLIGFLASRIRVQQSALSAQEQELEEERSAAEKLRRQATTQLQEIEDQARTLGNERMQLREAIGVGKRLDHELLAADRRADHLHRRTLRLTMERDALTQQAASLIAERDGLLRDKRTLGMERDLLRQDKRSLGEERDGLLRDKRAWHSERAALVQDRSALTEERDALRSARSALERAHGELKAERDGLREEKKGLGAERDDLLRQKNALAAERDSLVKEQQALAARNDELRKELEALKAQPEPDTSDESESPPAGAPGASNASLAP